MVIDPNNLNSATQTGSRARFSGVDRGTKAAPDSAQSAPSSDSDNVSLSDTAQSLGRLETAVEQSEVVDSKRVAEIKLALESGYYEADAAKIAEVLLAEEIVS
jgi:negative regulator of flagellin synthesis FlgM